MKKNLEILEIEPKLTKDEKKYWRVKTSVGWMNCWKEDIKEYVGKVACVEVTEKEGTNFRGEPIVFKNIINVYGESEDEIAVKGETDEKPEVVRPGETIPKSRNTTMYVSYAKDIFVALEQKEIKTEATMKRAIELVKQAKSAFE